MIDLFKVICPGDSDTVEHQLVYPTLSKHKAMFLVQKMKIIFAHAAYEASITSK